MGESLRTNIAEAFVESLAMLDGGGSWDCGLTQPITLVHNINDGCLIYNHQLISFFKFFCAIVHGDLAFMRAQIVSAPDGPDCFSAPPVSRTIVTAPSTKLTEKGRSM